MQKLVSSKPAAPTEGPRVLIVDDNREDRNLVTQCLHPRGYRIFFAENGQQGIARAQALLPDLILMDVSMPGTDGLAACRLIKAMPQLRSTPVFFLSAAAAATDRVEGLRAGAVDYLTKPFNFDELLLRIAVHLAKRPALQEISELPREGEDEGGKDLDSVLFHAAYAIINDDLSQTVDIEQIAQAVGTTARRLTAAFRRCAESTVFEVSREARMTQARSYLCHSSMDVAEIARAVGFVTPRNFSSAFKERFGMTPTALRKSQHE